MEERAKPQDMLRISKKKKGEEMENKPGFWLCFWAGNTVSNSSSHIREHENKKKRQIRNGSGAYTDKRVCVRERDKKDAQGCLQSRLHPILWCHSSVPPGAWTRTMRSVGSGRTQPNPASWQAIPRFQGSWLGFAQMRTRETGVR